MAKITVELTGEFNNTQIEEIRRALSPAPQAQLIPSNTLIKVEVDSSNREMCRGIVRNALSKVSAREIRQTTTGGSMRPISADKILDMIS